MLCSTQLLAHTHPHITFPLHPSFAPTAHTRSLLVYLSTKHPIALCVCRSIAKNAIDMFLVMGVCDRDDLKMLRNDRETEAKVIRGAVAVNDAFREDFERPFATHTAAYYRTFADRWIVVDDIASFLRKVSHGRRHQSDLPSPLHSRRG